MVNAFRRGRFRGFLYKLICRTSRFTLITMMRMGMSMKPQLLDNWGNISMGKSLF